MKINNLTKIIITIVIFLSISLAIKAANLGYIKKNTDTNPPISVVEPVNEELKNPTFEMPITVEDIPTVEDTPTTAAIPTTEPILNDKKPSEDKPIENSSDDDKIKNNKSKNDKSNNNSDKKPNSNSNKNSDKKPNKNSNNSSNKNSNGANNSKNNQSIVASKIISKNEAVEIGLKKIGAKSELIDVDSVLDHNPPKYILTISKNKSKYYIEVHAKTGAILDYEKE